MPEIRRWGRLRSRGNRATAQGPPEAEEPARKECMVVGLRVTTASPGRAGILRRQLLSETGQHIRTIVNFHSKRVAHSHEQRPRNGGREWTGDHVPIPISRVLTIDHVVLTGNKRLKNSHWAPQCSGHSYAYCHE